MNISIVIAQEEHFKYAENYLRYYRIILLRGTGIAKKLLTISKKNRK
jgi:hypothetical protein